MKSVFCSFSIVHQVMLLVPEGLYWSQVTPSCLIGLDDNGHVVEGTGSPEETAMCIHRGVRMKNKHKAVLHLHSPYATALGIKLSMSNI